MRKVLQQLADRLQQVGAALVLVPAVAHLGLQQGEAVMSVTSRGVMRASGRVVMRVTASSRLIL